MKSSNDASYTAYYYLVEQRLVGSISVVNEFRKTLNDRCSSNTYKRVYRIKEPAIIKKPLVIN